MKKLIKVREAGKDGTVKVSTVRLDSLKRPLKTVNKRFKQK